MLLLTLALLPLLPSPAPQDIAALAGRTSTEGELVPLRFEHERLQVARRSLAGVEIPLGPGSFLTVNDEPEGDMPRDLDFTPDGTTCLIANRDTDTVTFLDVATRTIVATVGVGDFPVDVAVSPSGNFAVVPNVFSDSVSVIDVATRSVVATVPITGSQPYRVEVASDGSFAVVGVINDAISSSVSVISLSTFTELRSFPTVPQGVIGGFFTPESGIFGNLFTQFRLASDDTKLVVPDRGGSRVAVYDVTSGAALALLPTAAQPTAVDVSADATLAVVTHEGTAQRLSTIDLVGLTVTNSFATPAQLVNQVVRITPDKSHAIVAILNQTQFLSLSSGAATSTISTGTVGDIEISFDGAYAFVSNFNARVISIASQSLVRTLTLASCYDAAVSPVEHRAVALNNRFREDAQVYDIDGAAGFVEGAVLTGEPQEGDAPRTLALSSDGTLAVVANNTSDNAAVVDLQTGTVRAYVPTGTRSLGVAISPDGTTAVVANGDNDTVSIVDLSSDTTVAQLFVPSRPGEVAISPDGARAYVTTVAGTDRLHFIDLNGAASSVVGSLITGQMGSITYTYGVLSGIALSPDGGTLAVCISFDDELMLVDTQTLTEVARVAVGDFPVRATFSPDGTRIYVTNSFGDSLSVVSNAGAASALIGTVGGIEFPLQVDVDPLGAYAYVGRFDFSSPRVQVVDTASLAVVASVPVASTPRSSRLFGGELYVSLTGGQLAQLRAAGPASAVEASVPLSGGPSDMVFSPQLGLAVAAQPGAGDGLDLVSIGGGAYDYCVGAPNSAGPGARLSFTGTRSIAANDFRLVANGSAPFQPGLFFYGPSTLAQPFGDGVRCVGGALFRLLPPQPASPVGVASRLVDFGAPPAGSGPGTILAGSTWYFQWWYRDPAAGGSGFNTSNGLAASFLP